MKERWKLLLPIALMAILAISMWPGMTKPLADLFHLSSGQNLSAAYAMAFCAGVYFPQRLRWWLPLLTFAIINILTNNYYDVPLFNRYLFLKVGAFAVLIWLGTRYSAKNGWFKLVGGGLLSAIVFYIITNTASWMWDPNYTKTLVGWLQALTIGTPGFPPTISFFLNSLLSGGLFTGLFVGAMKMTAADEAEETEKEETKSEEPDTVLPAPEESEA